MEEYVISLEGIKGLLENLTREGFNIYAPSKNNDRFVKVKDIDEVALFPDRRPTDISAKECLFPKCEPVFYYKREKNNVEIVDIDPNGNKVLFGLKPCDAASFTIIHKVFNWDYKDKFYNKRFDNSLIIGLACTYLDDYCFCTSVGLSPVSTVGSDILLVRLSDVSFGVIVITDKGGQLVKRYPQLFEKGEPTKSKQVLDSIGGPARKFDHKKVKEWLDNNFETDFFNSIGDICVGCGQCTFVCPTCHCFDIVDEDYLYSEGRRMKNWDGCQFYLFTLHASGHNPRDTQYKRYRQRVNHKFKYYVDRFQEVLCTGCGRCSRGCPVSIDIGDIVSRISKLS
ncbi:MAG: 4Fe-4S dicluster domain-containing protein [Deltaproteobacteria bacterium]|nr:4Fe-4S dicluster domain-containing protein [Deltaproteobacteria bacterium]